MVQTLVDGMVRRSMLTRASDAPHVSVVASCRSRLWKVAAVVAVLLHHDAVAQQPLCSDRYFVDAVGRVNADCCASAPTGAGHRRTQAGDTCSGVPRECTSEVCADTYTEFFTRCESYLRSSAAFNQYQELNSDCIAKARERPNSLPVEPETEPEPGAFAAGCPPAFLGPDLGYVNVMDQGPDGRCSLSLHSLSIVCSGAMFQTCIDFLHSSDMGPGDRNDPDYRAKHPEPEPWGGGG